MKETSVKCVTNKRKKASEFENNDLSPDDKQYTDTQYCARYFILYFIIWYSLPLLGSTDL